MITGVVRSNEGRIRLKVRGRGGREQEIEGVLDTGYSAALTLPPAVITALNLRLQCEDYAKLADGSTCTFNAYEAEVIWDGKPRALVVHESNGDLLVGMKLLKGHELKMHVRYGGKVTIRRLRKRT